MPHDTRTDARTPEPPTFPPPQPPGLTPVLERNIRALTQRRQREKQNAGPEEKIADAITRFAGSMIFVYVHLLIFGVWVLVMVGFVILGTGLSRL